MYFIVEMGTPTGIHTTTLDGKTLSDIEESVLEHLENYNASEALIYDRDTNELLGKIER